jgi:hypothetical protein
MAREAGVVSSVGFRDAFKRAGSGSGGIYLVERKLFNVSNNMFWLMGLMR